MSPPHSFPLSFCSHARSPGRAAPFAALRCRERHHRAIVNGCDLVITTRRADRRVTNRMFRRHASKCRSGSHA
jgi:hypothetical protein